MPRINFHWSSPVVLFLCLASTSISQSRPEVRALEPGKPIKPELISSNEPRPSDKIDDLALKLIEAKTDDERRSLLEREKEFVTEKLSQALLTQARIYVERGALTKALAVLQLAQRVAEPIGDKIGFAQALTRTGNIYRMLGEYDSALDHLRKALPLHESLANKTGVFNTLSFINTINTFTGDHDLELARRLLDIAEDSHNKEWIAISLSQIGAHYFALGNYAFALDYHQKSLTLYEEINNKPGTAFALHGIGNSHRMYGNYNEALSYFQKSLALSEQIGSADLSIRTLVNLGALHRAQGNYAQAEEHLLSSIKLIETSRTGNFSGNNFWLSLALSNLAEISRLQRNYQQALAYLGRSSSLSASSGSKEALAYALGRTAAVMVLQRNFTGALEAASQAATIARQTGGRDAQWRAHLEAGKAFRGLNQVAQARKEFEEAISLVESVRGDALSNEARSSYFATTQDPYEQYIDLLMELHKQQPADNWKALAFETSERARARSLLDALQEAHADIRQGVEIELLDRDRTLRRELNVAAGRHMRFLTGMHNSEQLSAAKKEVDELTTKLQELRSQIRLKSPRYAELTQPVPLTLRQIQRDVLDPDTALLEYKLGQERSFLWVVTATSINALELPRRSELEDNVRQAVALLNDGERWTTRGPRLRAEYEQAVSTLSRVLLPPPLMSQLNVRRLVIVGDGALQYLPFSALFSPNPQVQTARLGSEELTVGWHRPLIADYELVSLPSASTLAALRRETLNRPRRAKSVAVLADPVFEATDERVKREQIKTSASKDTKQAELSNPRTILERALGFDTGGVKRGLGIARLPFTRFEANGILASVPTGLALSATDFQANRETAASAELAQYRFIHFATHGILNSEHPELSGIVLSLVNEQGQPVDGFLRLHDIYNLNLPADLVVLSACQTGLGKEIRGEGLVGLTRGFMYAGAPRVVASLWKVDDAATAELMKRFYSAMLKDNLRPAAALRRAKIEMWKQPRWHAPFFWAAFELQGEWK